MQTHCLNSSGHVYGTPRWGRPFFVDSPRVLRKKNSKQHVLSSPTQHANNHIYIYICMYTCGKQQSTWLSVTTAAGRLLHWQSCHLPAVPGKRHKHPPTFRRRGVGGPHFHLSSLPHKKENGTTNGIPEVTPHSQFHF